MYYDHVPVHTENRRSAVGAYIPQLVACLGRPYKRCVTGTNRLARCKPKDRCQAVSIQRNMLGQPNTIVGERFARLAMLLMNALTDTAQPGVPWDGIADRVRKPFI